MTNPRERINSILQTLPEEVRLVAVSKYHSTEMIQNAYDGGQRIFGESHVQELVQKYEVLPKDIEWHFIGHLQTNKVKYIAPFVSLIHAVDSEHLLWEIDKQAKKCGRIIPVLMQVHVAREETKFGFLPNELLTFMQSGAWQHYENVSIHGLMCMATNCDDETQIACEFEQAKGLYEAIKKTIPYQGSSCLLGAEQLLSVSEREQNGKGTFNTRSWGMSNDYLIAIRHGSNMVRIGSLIFGERVYE